MPITCQEKVTGDSGAAGADGRIVKEYIVKGTNSRDDAEAEVNATAPSVYAGLVRQRPTLSRVRVDDATSDGTWEAAVAYLPVQFTPRETGFQYYRKAISQGSRFARFGRSAQSYSNNPAWTNTYSNAINLVPGNPPDVQGASVGASTIGFEIGWIFDTGEVTTAFLNTIDALRDTINSAEFWGCAVGEARFVGATLEARNNAGQWLMSFQFAKSPNLTNTMVGGISVTYAGGHDIVYPIYASQTNAAQASLVPSVMSIQVVQYYIPAAWTGLGIGTDFPSGVL